jgi:hypothetical protein
MWTQFNIQKQLTRQFFVVSRLGRLSLRLLNKKLCPSEVVLLLRKNMNFIDTISLSNSGMASAGELILFFGVIALMIFDEIISNKK